MEKNIDIFDELGDALKEYIAINGPVTLTDNGILQAPVLSEVLPDNVKDIVNITNRMVELYSRKNRDYGNTFDQSLDEDGLLVAKIRLQDKFGRFSTLIKQEATVDDETMIDTLIDLAIYSVMTIRWIESRSYDGR